MEGQWDGEQRQRLVLTGKAASDGVKMISEGQTGFRSTGTTVFLPWYLSNLATAHIELNQFDDARQCINKAFATLESTKEGWCEAETHRIAGVIALKSDGANASKAQEHFERSLEVARKQWAKSWELRAAMSMARLWRDHAKRDEARELLAPVYGWFTEGFDTRDLKEAKALLDALAAEG